MKRYLSIRYFKKSLLAFVISLMLSTQAAADNDVNALISYLQSVLNATVESVATYIYEFNEWLPKTVVTNLNAEKAEKSAQIYARALSFCQIYRTLPRHKDAPEASLPEDLRVLSAQNKQQLESANLREFCKRLIVYAPSKTDPFVFKRDLSKQAASDTEAPSTSRTFTLQRKMSTAANGDNMFNFENIITPSLYNEGTYKNALDFVAFSGRIYEPFPLDLKKWGQSVEDYPDTKEFINYQMAVRSYVSAQSVALGNLYRMISERTGQKEIKDLELKNDDDVLIESPMQYQEYLANRRASSQEWYATMSSASANTVSREMLFVLAEIQRSLYRLEKTNERMLATFSVMQLNSLYSSTRPELNSLGAAVSALGTTEKESIKPPAAP